MARVALLTTSDKGAAGERDDASGAILAARITAAGHKIADQRILPDDREQIAAQLREWCDRYTADVILTTGGTGLTERDVTPEATRDVAEREVPGIIIALTVHGMQYTPFAPLSRGVAVTRGRTLIVNLPGAPKGVEQGLEVLVPMISHVSSLLGGPVEH